MDCALFFDITDDDVRQCGQKIASIADLIKSTIVEPFKLRVTFSFLDSNEFSSDVYQSLKKSFEEAYPGLDIESGDIKESMRKFVESAGQDCTIILLSGDADYSFTLSGLKKLHNVSIHIIRLDDSFSSEQVQIADYTFMLNNGVLKPIKSTGSPKSSYVSRNVHDDTDWKIFFRYNCDVPPIKNFVPTKWSLLYNLFEKLYDLGAKKVIFDGNVYCAHFDSASAYQDVLNQIQSEMNDLKDLKFVKIHNKQEVTERMNRYSGIPWCLTEELNLFCLVIKIESKLHDHFIDIGKSILGNRECIFIKSIPGEILIGFPDELICENSKKRVDGFIKKITKSDEGYLQNIPMAKPSNELLESIAFEDLAGDAYDLAFLSSPLEDLKPIERPKIIERIRMQRMQKQECNEAVFHFTVKGWFKSWWYPSFPEPLPEPLYLEDVDIDIPFNLIVKIFVKFSKVIPLAARVCYDEINLMYDSEYEAKAACYFINELTIDEVPYFKDFDGASEVQQWPIYDNGNRPAMALPKYSEYYIINDKRKVLEKIAQKLNSNSSKVQLASDNDSLDEELAKKLQNLFVILITNKSDFNFTSGMISIIKMNLEDMDCQVCIEFEDKIWVAFDDLEKGKKAKARIDHIKFKILHEKDDDDFEVGVVMEESKIQESPPKVTKMLANKLMNPKTSVRNVYSNCDAYPLGHFNYSYRKAVGMSTARYCDYCKI